MLENTTFGLFDTYVNVFYTDQYFTSGERFEDESKMTKEKKK